MPTSQGSQGKLRKRTGIILEYRASLLLRLGSRVARVAVHDLVPGDMNHTDLFCKIETDMSTDKYLLARSTLSSARLNLQYYLWREAVGFNLHPTIPVETKNWKVADVATGTGLWLCELAKNAPSSAQFDGFDISTNQFPHPSCLPKNVTLRQLDARSSAPDALCGKYHVVHVRLLFAVIDGNDPTPILNHCIKLLKPGGYLQWDELDPAAFRPLPRPKESSVACLEELAWMWKNTKQTGWVERLHENFNQNGLDLLAADTYTEREWQRHMMMETWCLTADEYASTLSQAGEPGKAKEVRKLSAGAHEEIKQGSFFAHTIRIVVGRQSNQIFF